MARLCELYRRAGRCPVLAAAVLLTACAAPGVPADDDAAAEPVRADYDPWEPLNRGLYRISDTVDRYTLKPVARGYEAVVPTFARRGVTNFSKNLLTPRSAINNLLQGKPGRSVTDVARFFVNSTAGIGGLIDIASASGLEEYEETFSQTLAVWGIPEGPYVYVPVLGPNTLLDALATPIDLLSDPLAHYDNSSVRTKVYVLRAIDLRYRLLSAEELLADSKDPYLTIRESYLQNRRYQVHDGNPPSSEEEDALFDEFFDEE